MTFGNLPQPSLAFLERDASGAFIVPDVKFDDNSDFTREGPCACITPDTEFDDSFVFITQGAQGLVDMRSLRDLLIAGLPSPVSHDEFSAGSCDSVQGSPATGFGSEGSQAVSLLSFNDGLPWEDPVIFPSVASLLKGSTMGNYFWGAFDPVIGLTSLVFGIFSRISLTVGLSIPSWVSLRRFHHATIRLWVAPLTSHASLFGVYKAAIVRPINSC